jgi:SAM-dependent methyltransferase
MLERRAERAMQGEEARIRAAFARRLENDPRYSWFSPGHVFMVQERERRLLALLRQYGFDSLRTRKILEIGCGTGYWLREFIKWGARPENITGVDLLPERIVEAGILCPSQVTTICGSAGELGLPDRSYDLVLQSTVFSSILDSEMRRRVAGEMLRVLKPDGLVVWYDYHVNNPRNRDVRGVGKAEIRDLFPDSVLDLRPITVAPPLVRRLAPYSFLTCYLLGWIPWLCTHYLGVIRRTQKPAVFRGARPR